MWKDFLFFSASQRVAVLLLLSLIFIVILANMILPHYAYQPINLNDSIYQAEFELFKSSLKAKEYPKQRYPSHSSFYPQSKQFNSYPQAQLKQLFTFDPNTLDSAGFVSLGLKPYIASNILKYRAKGGVFQDRTSFAKVYGISDEQFAELEEYICIAETHDRVSVQEQNPSVSLNTATPEDLMQIKGIGKSYANSIIRYRQLLGGYIRITQLKEIYGMNEETYEKIHPYLTIDSTNIQKVKINIASIEKLKAHPYINFYQAKQIYEHRRKVGKLSSIDDLRHLSELTEEDLERIAGYVEF